jgi:hypothetical protein
MGAVHAKLSTFRACASSAAIAEICGAYGNHGMLLVIQILECLRWLAPCVVFIFFLGNGYEKIGCQLSVSPMMRPLDDMVMDRIERDTKAFRSRDAIPLSDVAVLHVNSDDQKKVLRPFLIGLLPEGSVCRPRVCLVLVNRWNLTCM